MTRKQAVCKALELLRGLEPSREIAEVMEKLGEVRDELPFTKWSEAAIHDTLTQFAAEHGRNPTSADLKRAGLPPHTVIKLRFGMTAKEFLDTYYPPAPRAFASVPYGEKSKEAWTEDFIRQVREKKPASGVRYNETRATGSPSWLTIAKYNGVSRWRELLSLLGLAEERQRRKGDGTGLNVTRTITIDGRLITDEEWHEYLALASALEAAEKGKVKRPTTRRKGSRFVPPPPEEAPTKLDLILERIDRRLASVR